MGDNSLPEDLSAKYMKTITYQRTQNRRMKEQYKPEFSKLTKDVK